MQVFKYRHSVHYKQQVLNRNSKTRNWGYFIHRTIDDRYSTRCCQQYVQGRSLDSWRALVNFTWWSLLVSLNVRRFLQNNRTIKINEVLREVNQKQKLLTLSSFIQHTATWTGWYISRIFMIIFSHLRFSTILARVSLHSSSTDCWS